MGGSSVTDAYSSPDRCPLLSNYFTLICGVDVHEGARGNAPSGRSQPALVFETLTSEDSLG